MERSALAQTLTCFTLVVCTSAQHELQGKVVRFRVISDLQSCASFAEHETHQPWFNHRCLRHMAWRSPTVRRTGESDTAAGRVTWRAIHRAPTPRDRAPVVPVGFLSRRSEPPCLWASQKRRVDLSLIRHSGRAAPDGGTPRDAEAGDSSDGRSR